MTRTPFFLCILCLMLSACSYQYQRINTTYPNAQNARKNAATGLKYLHVGDTNQAMARLQTAFQQNPRDPIVIDAIAYYHEKTGQVDKADQLYMYALSMGTDQGAANQNYGAFLCRNGYYQESISYFREATRIPNYAQAHEAYKAMNYCSQKMHHALGDHATWAYYMTTNKR